MFPRSNFFYLTFFAFFGNQFKNLRLNFYFSKVYTYRLELPELKTPEGFLDQLIQTMRSPTLISSSPFKEYLTLFRSCNQNITFLLRVYIVPTALTSPHLHVIPGGCKQTKRDERLSQVRPYPPSQTTSSPLGELASLR